QYEFSGRSTGTDTDSFAHCQSGIPSALISLPVKYMHTTCEVLNSEDIEKVIFLMYQSIKTLDTGFNVKSL
ncbi:MAG: M42 family peptidase, partial [Cytophagales bacterium]|nr:M42 family peptidase [Cytophagales bacterium]